MPGRGMGTRRTPTGGRGEGGEVGGRVAYMYMLPAILPLGNVVASRKGGAKLAKLGGDAILTAYPSRRIMREWNPRQMVI